MTRPTGRSPAAQVQALASAFLTRFFDSEISGGSTDLRTSYFWLLAFLAAPAMLLPGLLMGHWDFIALYQGLERLRELSRADKTFAIGFGMVAIGLVSALTWHSVLLDRRDALVLGPLPVTGRTIVRAKLAAMAQYVAITALALHGLSSVAFGFLLAARNTLTFALIGIVAHFLACFTASIFVFVTGAAIQGVSLAVLGPRLFRRVSPLLHVSLVASVVLGLLFLPVVAGSVVSALASGRLPTWMLGAPPVWFLGVYETVLTTSDWQLKGLAIRAVLALAAVIAITVVSYPIGYRRLTASVIESPEGSRVGAAARLTDWISRTINRRPAAQAACQFLLMSIGRVSSLRFVLALALGLVVTWTTVTFFEWADPPENLPPGPSAGLLALPLATMAFLLAGLRIAVAMPADLRAAWIVDALDAPRAALRSGTWRAMLLVGVLPVIAVQIPLYWRLWNGPLACAHALICLACGTLLVEMALWRFADMPCSRPWRPERAGLRALWPVYLIGFFLLTTGLATLAAVSVESWPRTLTLAATLFVLAGLVRLSHHRQPLPTAAAMDEPAPREVLNLY